MDFLIGMGKEIIYFNSFESLFLLLLFLLEIGQRISIKKSIFHIIMLSIANYFCSAIVPVPILIQVVYIVVMSLYFGIIFRINFLKSLIVNVKIYFILFILEMSLGMIFQKLFGLEFISMSNDTEKLLFLLPVRIIEVIFIIILYKYKKHKGGNITHEKIIESYS